MVVNDLAKLISKTSEDDNQVLPLAEQIEYFSRVVLGLRSLRSTDALPRTLQISLN